MIRLQKLLAQRGVASRRACEELILAGRVTVNGAPAQLGQSVDEQSDTVLLDGRALPGAEKLVYLMLCKPRGVLTTMHDDRGRTTVAQLVEDCPVRVFPVGRLDYDSEGLLLMTNDGELTNVLTHPSFEKKKTYHVVVTGDVTRGAELLKKPMTVDGYAVAKPEVSILSETRSGGTLSVTIREGRNRQIRKMCDQCGLKVDRLCRVSVDGLTIGRLKPGTWRYLTPEEVSRLKNR